LQQAHLPQVPLSQEFLSQDPDLSADVTGQQPLFSILFLPYKMVNLPLIISAVF
jgi:hypothetical protein